MSAGQSGGPTIASDEDVDWGYVLADEHAPDYETARELLRRIGHEQWSMSLGTILDHDPRRRSYKWVRDEHGEDNLMPCEPDDPARDSDWWVFDLSMNDHDLIDPASSCPHTDVGFLRSAQLADDEIEVVAYMASDGRCPICRSEHEDAYTEAVRFKREGHQS